jgi:hypothetical protein
MNRMSGTAFLSFLDNASTPPGTDTSMMAHVVSVARDCIASLADAARRIIVA